MDATSIDPIADLAQEASVRQARENAVSAELGREDFLRLLIAKMENQDPLSPTQDTEFIEQLATFSSLEQLISVNQNLGSLAIGQMQIVNSQALDLLGKEALVEAGDTVRIQDGVPDTIVYALDEGAVSASITILGADGTPVRVLELEPDATGRTTLEWDGTDQDGKALPDGDYTFTTSAVDANGEPVAMAVFRSLAIDGVNFLDGGISLVSGDREIPFESILEFRAGS